jgi:hypothetical protein
VSRAKRVKGYHGENFAEGKPRLEKGEIYLLLFAHLTFHFQTAIPKDPPPPRVPTSMVGHVYF